jgi:hypothetical protein
VSEPEAPALERRQVMLSLKKLLVALVVVVVLVAAITGATPREADAGIGSSPGAPSGR